TRLDAHSVRASIAVTDAARWPELSCDGERLTPARIGRPASCQLRHCSNAAFITQLATASEIGDVLTTGMKAAGASTPRVGCRQRIRASAPTRTPAARLICG